MQSSHNNDRAARPLLTWEPCELGQPARLSCTIRQSRAIACAKSSFPTPVDDDTQNDGERDKRQGPQHDHRDRPAGDLFAMA